MEEIVKDFHKYLLEQKCKDFAVFSVKIDGQNVNCILVSLPTTLENKKLADKIMVEFGIENFPEGYAKGEWIVYDFGNIILNSFIPSIREKFNLEKLWQKEKIDALVKYNEIEEATKKGKVEGIAEGIKEKEIEIVKNMLKKEMSIKDISEITGLTEQDIQNFTQNGNV